MDKEKSKKKLFMMGNEACAAGAIAAGVRFFAGYPITPSTEIAEYMARELPKIGGTFIQMEDEMGSIGAVLGASVAGAKAMTATSAMGFSLMQEFISNASVMEIPCLIANIMRGGPAGGSATQPAQADVMQSKWGTNADHPVIVLSATSVSEMFFLTVKAVNFSEKFRVPVILLSDESIGHLREGVEIPDPGSLDIVNRRKPSVPPELFEPMRAEIDETPPMAVMGEGYRVKGYCRNPRTVKGDPIFDPEIQDFLIRRLHRKIDSHLAEILLYEQKYTEDADIIIFAHGSIVRSAYRALTLARELGIKVGVFKPVTIWPFPFDQIEKLSRNAKAMIVPELNMGQIIGEVDRACRARVPVVGLTKVDGNLITAEEILSKIRETAEVI